MNQKEYAIQLLESCIDKAYEDEETQEIEMYISSAEIILGVLKAQDVKEPLEDIVFFTGRPDKNSVCYHALVPPRDFNAMQADPNIHMMKTKKFTGVMDKVFEPAFAPVWHGNKAYCAECGKRLLIKYKPSYCHKCGRAIYYNG